jgi:hypothetical protein
MNKNKKVNSCLYFRFANLVCKISGPKKQIMYIKKCYIKSPFRKFLNSKQENYNAYLKIKIIKAPLYTEKFCFKPDTKPKSFLLKCSENTFFTFPIIEQALRKIYYILFFKNLGFIMHASAVLYNKKLLIFAGESGEGKSTIANILCKTKQFKSIADNNVFIRKVSNQYYAYLSPFLEWNVYYKKPISVNSKVKIGKIYILNKANNNSVVEAKFDTVFKKIGKQIQIPLYYLSDNEQQKSRRLIFKFITDLIEKDIKVLNFKKDNSIISKIKRA